MGKRKRKIQDNGISARTCPLSNGHLEDCTSSNLKGSQREGSVSIQIITGSYDRVLHGVIAEIDIKSPESDAKCNNTEDTVSFADTFLLNAHASAVSCLALSPSSHTKDTSTPARIVLASGSTDERINLYSISANAPPRSIREKASGLPSLNSVAKLENPKNRELGTILHHSSAITKLCFATRSKLISASADNTISVSRARDWTVLSTMKAPIPQVQGRPSGDTSALGKDLGGINDFDFDPSMKIMISVGKGEKCMRLWNLVTGKRAGALNFGRDLLKSIGENKYYSGEGRKILFEPDGGGFVVCFERSAVVYDMQSQVRGIITPPRSTKLHQMHYLSHGCDDVIAISTEDGQILFYNTKSEFALQPNKSDQFKRFRLIGRLGGPAAGISSRIKDFEVLSFDDKSESVIVVTAGSDGAIRVWLLSLRHIATLIHDGGSTESVISGKGKESNGTPGTDDTNPTQLGRLLGRFETTNRITCLAAFIMLPEVIERDESQVHSPSVDAGSKPGLKSNGEYIADDEAGNVPKIKELGEEERNQDEGEFEGFE